MKQSKFKKIYKEEYRKLENEMNKRYYIFKLLCEFNEKHGVVPEKFQKIWEDFQIKDAGLLWDEQKGAVRILMKTARIHARRKMRRERAVK